jgi:hypothetical protein
MDGEPFFLSGSVAPLANTEPAESGPRRGKLHETPVSVELCVSRAAGTERLQIQSVGRCRLSPAHHQQDEGWLYPISKAGHISTVQIPSVLCKQVSNMSCNHLQAHAF